LTEVSGVALDRRKVDQPRRRTFDSKDVYSEMREAVNKGQRLEVRD
jgi:hypothetical protein